MNIKQWNPLRNVLCTILKNENENISENLVLILAYSSSQTLRKHEVLINDPSSF